MQSSIKHLKPSIVNNSKEDIKQNVVDNQVDDNQEDDNQEDNNQEDYNQEDDNQEDYNQSSNINNTVEANTDISQALNNHY